MSSQTPTMNRRTRTFASVLSLWTAFSLISLLFSNHVIEVDYAAYQYGFPFNWLVHQVGGLGTFPANNWTFIWYYALADFSLWLVVSLAVALPFSKARHFFRTVFPIAISIPFLTILSFDPFLIIIGLAIIAAGLTMSVLDSRLNRHEIVDRSGNRAPHSSKSNIKA